MSRSWSPETRTNLVYYHCTHLQMSNHFPTILSTPQYKWHNLFITEEVQKLTTFWPAWVNNVISIWTKCCVQDTPAHITCLYCLQKLKFSFSSAIHSQITICRKNNIKYVKKELILVALQLRYKCEAIRDLHYKDMVRHRDKKSSNLFYSYVWPCHIYGG